MFEKNFTNNDLCQVEKELNTLEPITCFYLSQKDRDVKKKLENLLNDEKEIISKQISSTDKKECKKLYADFLGKEKFIYEMYELMGENNRKASGCGEYIKLHLANAMEYDLRSTIIFLIKRKIFSALSFVLLGALLCVPYSIAIGKTIEISLGNIPFSMIQAFIIWIVYIVLCSFCVVQNILLFRVSYYSPSWLKWLYVLISVSYIVLIYFLPKIDISYFKYFYYLYIFLMALVFSMMHKYRNKDFEEFIFTFLLIMTIDSFILISHIVPIVVYYEYDTAHTVIITALAALMFIPRLLSLSNHLDYKTSLIINGIWIIFSIIFLSGLFVRIAGIANYQTDFDITKENIPEYVNLENINKCKNKPVEDINFIKYTCISDEMPSSTVKFKNILVKVKSDGRYWLEVVAEDQNKSKIDDYRFWISEKNIVN